MIHTPNPGCRAQRVTGSLKRIAERNTPGDLADNRGVHTSRKSVWNMIKLIVACSLVQSDADNIKAKLSIDKVVFADIKKRHPLDLFLFGVCDGIIGGAEFR